MKRRQLIKTTGAMTAALAIAGCTGEEAAGAGEQNEQDTGDASVTPQRGEEFGYFDIEGAVAEDENAQGVQFKNHDLFRVEDAYGVRWTVVNKTGEPLSNLTIHVRLLSEGGTELFETTAALSEVESIEDLGVNESWSGDLFFEGANPDEFIQPGVHYEIWATAEPVGEDEQSTGNGTSTNASASLQR
jgi:hypothetical protein